MKEIGGYLELEKFMGEEYYSNLIALNSGRFCLLYLFRSRDIKKIYIPYFLCNSISETCKKYQFNFEYYNIDKNFDPIFNTTLKEREYLYIVNYYGQFSNKKILKFKRLFNNIIIDNVHAFFQKPVNGIDTIYSCRKFFGVPDGAYLATNIKMDDTLEIDISTNRMGHILGRFEGTASDFYADFKINEDSFKEMPLRSMSTLTHNLLRNINYNYVINTRNKNYQHLSKHLKKINKLALMTPIAPYSYPFYCEDGIAIKKKLAEKKIYIATLWPNVLDLEGTMLEKEYTKNILPLPCDQRYNRDDMTRIIDHLLEAISNRN